VAGLLKALSGNQMFQLCAIVLNEGRLAGELRKCRIEVKIIPEGRTGFISILKEASRYLGSRNIQILHSHRYKENLLGALLARRCRVPFVVRTVHGGVEPFQGPGFWKRLVIRNIDRCVARFATDRVISVSAELGRNLVRHVSPRKVVVVRNGLDLESIHSHLSVSEAKRNLGIPEGCLVMGYAGRLEPVKRLDLLVAAARLVAARLPETRFVIVGEGREGPRLQQLVAASRLGDRVWFLGHRDDIHDVMRAFDLFVLCSDHEGLPMVLLEALYLGVPVVARRVGGIPEVLGDGLGGVLVDSGDPPQLAESCVRLLTNSGLRNQLARAGVSRVTDAFSAERTASEVTSLYLSLAAGGRV
jgi:L-malate glycosyltransferase